MNEESTSGGFNPEENSNPIKNPDNLENDSLTTEESDNNHPSIEAKLEGGDMQPLEDEKSEEETGYDGPVCKRCSAPVSLAMEYCEKCENEMKCPSIKPQSFIAAFILVLVSVFATFLLVPTCEIYLNVLKGDLSANKNNYFVALNYYSEAQIAAEENNDKFNGIIGTSEQKLFFSVGEKTINKIINATAVDSGIIEAGNLIVKYYPEKRVPADIKTVSDKYNKIEPTYTEISQLYSEYYQEYFYSIYYGAEFDGEISYKEFSGILDDAVKNNPDYVDYIVEYFRFNATAITSEDVGLQLKTINKVKALAPDECWLYCAEMMQLYLLEEMYDKVVETADLAIENNFKVSTAYLYKTEGLFRAENYEECIKASEEDAKKNGKNASTHVYKIRSLFLLGKKDEAFEHCEVLKGNESENSSYYAMLAELHRLNNDYDAALATCEDGLAIDQENLELYRQKGIVYMLKGDTASAKTTLETAADIGLTLELAYTIQVFSVLTDDTTWYKEIESLLTSSDYPTPDMVIDYKEGKISLEEIYAQGRGDVQ